MPLEEATTALPEVLILRMPPVAVKMPSLFPEDPLYCLESADALRMVNISGDKGSSLNVVDFDQVLGDLPHSRDVVDVDADRAVDFDAYAYDRDTCADC